MISGVVSSSPTLGVGPFKKVTSLVFIRTMGATPLTFSSHAVPFAWDHPFRSGSLPRPFCLSALLRGAPAPFRRPPGRPRPGGPEPEERRCPQGPSLRSSPARRLPSPSRSLVRAQAHGSPSTAGGRLRNTHFTGSILSATPSPSGGGFLAEPRPGLVWGKRVRLCFHQALNLDIHCGPGEITSKCSGNQCAKWAFTTRSPGKLGAAVT